MRRRLRVHAGAGSSGAPEGCQVRAVLLGTRRLRERWELAAACGGGLRTKAALTFPGQSLKWKRGADTKQR